MKTLSKPCTGCAQPIGSPLCYKLYLARVDAQAMQMEVEKYLCPRCYRRFGRVLMEVMGQTLAEGLDALRNTVHEETAVPS